MTSRHFAALLGLGVAAMLLSGCGGSSGRIDTDRWNYLYGDPDTGSADIGAPRHCCRHATRND